MDGVPDNGERESCSDDAEHDWCYWTSPRSTWENIPPLCFRWSFVIATLNTSWHCFLVGLPHLFHIVFSLTLPLFFYSTVTSVDIKYTVCFFGCLCMCMLSHRCFKWRRWIYGRCVCVCVCYLRTLSLVHRHSLSHSCYCAILSRTLPHLLVPVLATFNRLNSLFCPLLPQLSAPPTFPIRLLLSTCSGFITHTCYGAYNSQMSSGSIVHVITWRKKNSPCWRSCLLTFWFVIATGYSITNGMQHK